MPALLKSRSQLALDDPRYLRKLVREINQMSASVYLSAAVAKTESNPRLCGRASYSESKKVILVAACEGAGEKEVYEVTPELAGEAFMNGSSGMTIYACRSER